MILYLTRHGESIGNAKRVRQGQDGGLTVAGQDQAAALARRLSHLPIEALLASPFERTAETAAIVSRILGLPVEYSDLIKERVNPSSIISQPIDSPKSRQVIEAIYTRAADPDWRYQDGENMADIRTRALAFLDFISTKPQEHIAVITHGGFLRVLAGCMIFNGNLSLDLIPKFFTGLAMSYTGLTVAETVDQQPVPAWRIVTWNDQAHLG